VPTLSSSSPLPSNSLPLDSTNYQASGQLLTSTNIHNTQSVIQSGSKTLDNRLVEDLQPVLLDLPRSTASTPLPTTPFPPVDVSHPNIGLPPTSLLARPKTPILVTTRPSSVLEKRTRHVSKDDIARMMAELNAPLPPMVPIPQDIRASPLLFSSSSRGPGTPTSSGSKI